MFSSTAGYNYHNNYFLLYGDPCINDNERRQPNPHIEEARQKKNVMFF